MMNAGVLKSVETHQQTALCQDFLFGMREGDNGKEIKFPV
jgi:hypothetical protein